MLICYTKYIGDTSEDEKGMTWTINKCEHSLQKPHLQKEGVKQNDQSTGKHK